VGNPLFWLGLSLFLVAVSLAALLMVAIPTLRELSRAARSAEKLFDTLGRELPPTLEAIRLTGQEITGLTDDVSDGIQHAGRVVQQVDEGLTSARQQAKTIQTGTSSIWAGARAAWRAWSQPSKPAKKRRSKYLPRRSGFPQPDPPRRSNEKSRPASSANQSLPETLPPRPSYPDRNSAEKSSSQPPPLPKPLGQRRALIDQLPEPDPWVETSEPSQRPSHNSENQRSTPDPSEFSSPKADPTNPSEA
jgi:uncharacterized protein YoxC